MTEPVAYWHIPQIENEEVFVSFSPSKTSHFEDIPLYTAEQLRPRVKMTQAEFDEFSDLASYSKLIGVITHLYDEHVEKYSLLFKRFCGDNDTIKLAVLWSLFDPDNPEETIEIVENKKWFVRSKEQYEPDMDQGIAEGGYLYLTQGDMYSIEYYQPTPFKDEAKQFDTKEQADLWTNPLTEAVLLPVE